MIPLQNIPVRRRHTISANILLELGLWMKNLTRSIWLVSEDHFVPKMDGSMGIVHQRVKVGLKLPQGQVHLE